MTDTAIEQASGLDDLFHDVTLTDKSTGAAYTSGTVSVVLCAYRTATSLGTGATKALTHVAAGRWTGVHDDTDVATAIASLPVGEYFDAVLVVAGVAQGLIRRYEKVAVVDFR